MRSCLRLFAGWLALAQLLPAPASRAAALEWVERSNRFANELLSAQGPFEPLTLSFFGIPGFDDQVPDLGPGAGERFRAVTRQARDRLAQAMETETDARVRQDLAIMIASADEEIRRSELEERRMLPYADVGQVVYQSVAGLLANRQDDATRQNAQRRLARFAGQLPDTRPFTELLEARYTEAKQEDPARLRPVRQAIEQELANWEKYLAGIRVLLAEHELAAARPAVDALELQLRKHAEWLRAEVLPEARQDFRLPPELYAQALRTRGIKIEPEALIQQAQIAFAEIRNELQTVAALVARERGWPEKDYPAVIRKLKQEQLGPEQILPYYREVIAAVEEIIRREQLVALPDRPMQIRLATEAESAAQPAPHMDPPPMVNNAGEMGTFVLPLGNPTAGGPAERYDDFTYRAAAWTLVAHEGRPGHELQFASMVERGISIARFYFAFNSVNVEGWALYAEAELKPFEPLEGNWWRCSSG